jgi:hypothetical protein
MAGAHLSLSSVKPRRHAEKGIELRQTPGDLPADPIADFGQLI